MSHNHRRQRPLDGAKIPTIHVIRPAGHALRAAQIRQSIKDRLNILNFRLELLERHTAGLKKSVSKCVMLPEHDYPEILPGIPAVSL